MVLGKIERKLDGLFQSFIFKTNGLSDQINRQYDFCLNHKHGFGLTVS